MRKIMGVYAIQNVVNGKVYIGSSNNIDTRFKAHLSMLRNNRHHSIRLQRAWNKYGPENFKWFILKEVTDLELLADQEQDFINIFDSSNPDRGYNIASEAGSARGIHFTEEGYLFWINKKYVGFMGEAGFVVKHFADISFPKKCSFTDIGRMAILAMNMDTANMLVYRDGDEFLPMSSREIGKEFNLNAGQTGVFIRKMIRLGVMARVAVENRNKKETQFYISPLYFFSSNRLPLSLYLIFRHQLDEHLPKWVIYKFNQAKAERDRQKKSQ